VSGGSGSPGDRDGKRTPALQFLQVGLDGGDECPYVSTEQTVDELRDAVAPFTFDLDRENLTVTSIHAHTGKTELDEPPYVRLR
jgi:KaiC/GvpD/RAD55 family RecA-like ATPase